MSNEIKRLVNQSTWQSIMCVCVRVCNCLQDLHANFSRTCRITRNRSWLPTGHKTDENSERKKERGKTTNSAFQNDQNLFFFRTRQAIDDQQAPGIYVKSFEKSLSHSTPGAHPDWWIPQAFGLSVVFRGHGHGQGHGQGHGHGYGHGHRKLIMKKVIQR